MSTFILFSLSTFRSISDYFAFSKGQSPQYLHETVVKAIRQFNKCLRSRSLKTCANVHRGRPKYPVSFQKFILLLMPRLVIHSLISQFYSKNVEILIPSRIHKVCVKNTSYGRKCTSSPKIYCGAGIGSTL